ARLHGAVLIGGFRIAGDTKPVVRLGPAPETTLVASDRVGVGAGHGLVAAHILGNADGLAQAVRDVSLGGALGVQGPMQSAIHARVLVAHTAGGVDVAVDGRTVVGVAVALAIEAIVGTQRIGRAQEGWDLVLRDGAIGGVAIVRHIEVVPGQLVL